MSDAKFKGVTVNRKIESKTCIYHLVTLTVSCAMYDKKKLSEYFHLRKFPSIDVLLSYITESQLALSREVNLT